MVGGRAAVVSAFAETKVRFVRGKGQLPAQKPAAIVGKNPESVGSRVTDEVHDVEPRPIQAMFIHVHP